jgi:hypothetical protein
MALVAFSSFPFTYFGPLATGSRAFVALHHVHGAMFFAWLGLYVWQTRLAATGKIARHREIGLAGLAVTGTMIPLGLWLTLYAARARIERGDPHPFAFIFYNVVDLALFTLAMIGAIASITRNVEWHRRFNYAAALNLVGPAISRWFIPLPAWSPVTDFGPNILADLFLIPLALHDYRQTGRVHPATIIVIAAMVPLHFISPWIATGGWWEHIAPGILKFD